MKSRSRFALIFLLAAIYHMSPFAQAATPNIVLIYADDIGYGDLGCYGATKVKTPNLDQIAKEGLRFTDGHAPSATCTPSRYALMTGQYPWRKAGTGILPGDAPLILAPGSTTLPSLLKQAGYATGVVGKWHLGLGSGEIDWNGEIKPGPLEVGFDSCFIVPATGDRVPCVYVENHRVAGLDPKDPIQVSYAAPIGDDPTGKDHPELLKMKLALGHDNTIVNGISRIGYMSGGKAARWVDEDMADVLTKKATEFIATHKEHPFFLYFATHDIHVPRVPNARFAGKSECGVRGDVIQELDASVGEVLKALDRANIAKNTIVIFSSDNGPVVNDGYADGAEKDLNGHKPAGPLRGAKYSLYEAGTRVPFLVRWPAEISPGVSDALVCQIDLLASFAALVGRKLPDGAGPDSIDVLTALTGKSKSGRDHLVEHANGLSFRQGSWKLIPAGPSRLAGTPKKAAAKKAGQPAELYDLANDLGETKNLAESKPELVRSMTESLDRIRQNVTSTGR